MADETRAGAASATEPDAPDDQPFEDPLDGAADGDQRAGEGGGAAAGEARLDEGDDLDDDDRYGGDEGDEGGDEEVEDVAELVEIDLEDVLATATSERDEFRDHLLRLHADFDNYRKRVHKELGEAGDRALGSFVEELLPVLDAVDAARAHGVQEVEQVAGLLVDLLAKQGLERIGGDGDVFDPTLHDAVLHEAGDDDVQTVAQVLRAGWRWRGKVLRPAMVKVVGG